jgi:pyrimidine-specific ribonucleoside hydrolase
MNSTPRSLVFARLGWFLLAGIVLILEITYLPANVDRLYTDWQVLQSYPALNELVSLQFLGGLILVLRYLAIGFFWMAALLVFLFVGRRENQWAGMGIFSSALLLLVPLSFVGLTGDDSSSPAPWTSIFLIASQVMPLVAWVFFLLFYFLFPNGHFRPRWLGWVALLIGAALVVFLLILIIGQPESEWAWAASMLTQVAALLLGLGSQFYRYIRLDDASQKRQVRPVLVTLVLIPLFVLIPGLLGRSAWAGLLEILGSLLAPALLPLALLWAMFQRGLWDIHLDPRPKAQAIALAASLVLAWLVGLGVVYQANAPETAEAITFDALPASDQPRPVIIDTDMAPDDWMAILYLLQRPDIDVNAITVVGTGETHCAPGVVNALRLVALAGESGIPVACGRETPLAGDQVFPEGWRERADTLAGLDAPEVEAPASETGAVEMLVSMINASPEPVTLLTLGPLTNLAEAVQADAGILENIQQVYMMGGALEVLGNVSFSGIDNQVAEWNIFIDPLALRQVLESGAPVTFVPLDATNHAPVNLDFYLQLQANHRTPEAAFVYDLLTAQFDSVTSGIYYFWDPLAAAILVDESLAYLKEGNVMVNVEPGTSYGLTRLMNSGLPARYAKSVDAGRFEYEFLRTLNQP